MMMYGRRRTATGLAVTVLAARRAKARDPAVGDMSLHLLYLKRWKVELNVIRTCQFDHKRNLVFGNSKRSVRSVAGAADVMSVPGSPPT
jgi:hypothetical protein